MSDLATAMRREMEFRRSQHRADGGADIKMKHENINTGETMPETDAQRLARTGLSSLRVTDDASKAAQKTPNRVSLDSMLARIVHEEYINPGSIPHMTIAILRIDNGYALVGKSTPADPDNFDPELGRRFAKEDAIRQMWQLEAYLLREQLAGQGLHVDTGNPDAV